MRCGTTCPGFLSESYSGEGVEYTGRVGIPDIAVSPRPRITDAASLYTLGTAYSVAPENVEQFLAANWAVVSSLFTEHGPWEGFNTARQEVIRFQTSAHTFALILGFLGTASEDMKRYLDWRGCSARVEEVFRAGEEVDLLSGETQVFAWNDDANSIRSTRENGAVHVRSDRLGNAGIAFVSSRSQGVNLSGGLLTLRYRSAVPMNQAIIALKPPGGASAVTGLIPTEIFSHFTHTGAREEQIEVPLPATPGLARHEGGRHHLRAGFEGRSDRSVGHVLEDRARPIAGPTGSTGPGRRARETIMLADQRLPNDRCAAETELELTCVENRGISPPKFIAGSQFESSCLSRTGP